MNHGTVDYRYHHDSEFCALVKMFYQQLLQAKFTPTEIREAAMLAQIQYESNYPRPFTVSPDLAARLESAGVRVREV